MSATIDLPQVTDCTATSCAYNHDGCHAFAVTIDTTANCGTFLSLNEKGGLNVVAQVGACQRTDCTHNQALECRAPSITVGAGQSTAGCLSYQAA
ncbi:hypothetical protein FHX74_000057 [Friedmanniella endophytica]|uniref:DUF1540 domain-containing protein n=1 Tax=Microlunatus kandeliicorticis TaxID=1759536 RepID=A0A7W3P441_9ACTN|nr:DUF1540 domain-containing protein [Microlunatus kandeliicorticis]MBA8792463.1 hypothetical protein [Microlunatus kandeliicorticis]